jgi:hypothetical protein
MTPIAPQEETPKEEPSSHIEAPIPSERFGRTALVTTLCLGLGAAAAIVGGGAAMATTDPSPMPIGELPPGHMARISGLVERTLPAPRIKVAPIYMQYEPVKGETESKKRGKKAKKMQQQRRAKRPKGRQ